MPAYYPVSKINIGNRMKKLLIVSHTPSANTRALTKAVVEGASNADISGIEVMLTPPLETGPGEVIDADAIILGTTENFGYMSGAMKDFFDRIYYPCLEKTESLPFAMFIRAGNDGRGARSSINRITKGLSWKQVQEPLICRGTWQKSFLDQCEELGMTLAAGLEAGIF
jgi:multimeric flavodoxin WrbA